jgi:hypothetical protein
MRWSFWVAVVVLALLGVGWGKVYRIDLVPYGTTVLRFGEGVRYVATGWPYVQVQVLEGAIVLLRPLVREGEGELWVMLQDGRQYRFLLKVNKEGKTARSYYFWR